MKREPVQCVVAVQPVAALGTRRRRDEAAFVVEPQRRRSEPRAFGELPDRQCVHAVIVKVQVNMKVKPELWRAASGVRRYLASATPAQINSTTPKGHAPDKNP